MKERSCIGTREKEEKKYINKLKTSEVMGLNPVFKLYFHNCLSCVYHCDNH